MPLQGPACPPRHLVALGVAALAAWLMAQARPLPAAEIAPSPAAPVDFNRQIHPILSENCFQCHGPDDRQRKAKLRLDVKEDALGHGTVIVPGHGDRSELFDRLTSDDPSRRMPPAKTGKHLTPQQVDLVRRWIDEGANWTRHWAFVPPRRPDLPAVKDRSWVRNPIDSFVLSRLEKEGLRPSPEADRVTLLRRVTLDLTGLPPTPAEVDAFLADTSPDAYEKLVDRLLASPRYGERMALDWLDAARFADTHGYHIDSARDMTLWRDWVIRAFNTNMPFDRFTVEQVAGDLLPGATTEQKIASGFHRNHMINFEGGAIPEEYHTAYIVDRVNTTGTVWLGLTVGCAQCHDHKYDPLTQKEYYQLFGFFHNVPENGLDGRNGNAAPVLRLTAPEQQRQLDRLAARIKELEGRLALIDAAQAVWERTAAVEPRSKDRLPAAVSRVLALAPEKRNDQDRAALQGYYRVHSSEDGERLGNELARLRQERADLDRRVPTAMVMQEMPQPRDTFVLTRGQYDKHAEKVTAAVPAFLPRLPDGAPPNRLGLARWLVDPANPLTARVTVNRLWQTYFGTGIVKTAEDFGSQGEWPTHPELLDWLATEFVRSGWDVKAVQRLLVTSATYRQSSRVTPALAARDPENRLLARQSRLRLPAEFIRDQALTVSGLLDGEVGGASVYPYQPKGIWEELMSREDGNNFTAQVYVQGKGKELYRRGMYTFWKRTAPPPSLTTLDAPGREVCTVRRPRTNTPLQALVLMNDPTYVEAARKLAERLMAEADSPEERVALAFRLATARRPTAAETAVLRKVFEGQLAEYRRDPRAALTLLSVGESKRDERLDPAELAAWAMVASAILNLDETVTRG
jgi:mono/diheme cytochrome c family protein